jgi:hypothetical protein
VAALTLMATGKYLVAGSRIVPDITRLARYRPSSLPGRRS